ncbi:MAG: hypothetical protein D6719_02210 [Candidatus Dadabacteria bacterium]|nr:MAG: hypothetical protein D6719_02210 [Candidatus Dadabacteria bacterium]
MIHFLRHKSIRCIWAAADAVAVAGADQPNAGCWLQIHYEIRKTVISERNQNQVQGTTRRHRQQLLTGRSKNFTSSWQLILLSSDYFYMRSGKFIILLIIALSCFTRLTDPAVQSAPSPEPLPLHTDSEQNFALKRRLTVDQLDLYSLELIPGVGPSLGNSLINSLQQIKTNCKKQGNLLYALQSVKGIGIKRAKYLSKFLKCSNSAR